MQSGIQIHDSVIKAFGEMKLLSTKSKKFLRLCVSEDGTFIIVDNTFDIVQEQSEDNYLNFLKHLQAGKACFLIYDVCYETKNSLTKEDLVFVHWSPDDAPRREMIQYTTSKYSLKQKLEGLKADLQLNSLDDISRSILAEKLGNDVIKIEGVAV